VDRLARAAFSYGLTPVTHKTYVVGDTGIEPAAPNLDPSNGALIAAIAGPAEPRRKRGRAASKTSSR